MSGTVLGSRYSVMNEKQNLFLFHVLDSDHPSEKHITETTSS